MNDILLRVAKGHATEEELAALTVALLAGTLRDPAPASSAEPLRLPRRVAHRPSYSSPCSWLTAA
ncbi:acyl-CoA carboxylase epsilon subunit [Wenjunlia tyrosinilytica]|uniref:Acyl-CoA carboxylase subunit epsilon n=1 Tax=Wenjunlia tyrosinilytica TaxID=1544741 RepID=A0A917ZVM2_9ACTN|nr:acyl-CoA carboxylase epsilon subunit [Wenjunlia tyrosinilytica]GGO97782.1 hypothetical protein GCM10012280_60380 [Wenjunlia tyrosinilytica]